MKGSTSPRDSVDVDAMLHKEANDFNVAVASSQVKWRVLRTEGLKQLRRVHLIQQR